MSRPDEQFREAMRSASLDYTGSVVTDGRLHRFKAAGDHARNSWYVLHAGPPAAGAFGCWKRNFTETWCERDVNSLSLEGRKAHCRRVEQIEAEREREKTTRHANARRIAERILAQATPADPKHAYLVAKNVKPHGELQQWRGKLMVPLRDAAGTLHSLQFIDADGKKQFLPGGRVAGCYFTLSDKTTGILLIAEGFATAASSHEATGQATVAAMNCGNLLDVAKAIRAKWPDREIIIAADNDAFTTGKDGQPVNPGVEKATAAAKAICARLAVPEFKQASSKPTDFNDLHRLEGSEAVVEQLQAAGVQRETDDEVILRLAVLSQLDYERQRDKEAARLGCRTSILDKLVEARRPKANDVVLQGKAVVFADVEPWPDPVNGAVVLNEVADTYAKYSVLPPGAADALALWTAHAHCFEAFSCSPRLNITSPDKGCGKTTLRDVLGCLVPRPLPTENASVAVVFRLVELHKPTLLADEYDGWLRENDELRSLFNSGHRRGGIVHRCVGDDNTVRGFQVFTPTVLAGIGHLPGTLHDRSIVIRVVRAKPREVAVRFDSRRTQAESEICRRLARWCADHSKQIEAIDPVMPANAFNRLADNWRPLFAIAEVAGGDWPERARQAFELLVARDDADAHGIGTMLLADIHAAFNNANTDRMFSKALVESLVSMTERPWPEAHKGRPISETWLSRRLKAFEITPQTIRIGTKTGKGYYRDHFQDAFARFLPEDGDSSRHSVTMPENVADSAQSETSRPKGALWIEDAKEDNQNRESDGVTAPKTHPPELVEEVC